MVESIERGDRDYQLDAILDIDEFTGSGSVVVDHRDLLRSARLGAGVKIFVHQLIVQRGQVGEILLRKLPAAPT